MPASSPRPPGPASPPGSSRRDPRAELPRQEKRPTLFRALLWRREPAPVPEPRPRLRARRLLVKVAFGRRIVNADPEHAMAAWEMFRAGRISAEQATAYAVGGMIPRTPPPPPPARRVIPERPLSAAGLPSVFSALALVAVLLGSSGCASFERSARAVNVGQSIAHTSNTTRLARCEFVATLNGGLTSPETEAGAIVGNEPPGNFLIFRAPGGPAELWDCSKPAAAPAPASSVAPASSSRP